jgi:hypothetical protein
MAATSRKTIIQVLVLVSGLILVVLLTRAIDARRGNIKSQFGEQHLYVSGPTAKRLALAFNGLAADWYYMRSLQYVGQKILDYEQQHEGRIDFGSLADLDIRLLPDLLRVSTTLDPQFMAPYEYGAMILPELDSKYAIDLLNAGIAANPSRWRLYQYLGYIYWQRKDYNKAGEVYGIGSKLPGAPPWMAAMSARMKGEGGSRDAAREIYQHLYEQSGDQAVRTMVSKQLARLDSLDERDAIRRLLTEYAVKNGRCAASWREVADQLRAARLRVEATTGAPIDPSDTPYELIKRGCDVGLNINTKVLLK